MNFTLLIIAFLAILPAACTGGARVNGNIVKKRHAQFGVADLPNGWHRRYFRNADLFFEHDGKDASIYINSECERVSDSPLEALTAQMLVGMGKYEIISQKRLNIGDREALISEVNVNLDGVHDFLKIMVLRKNQCVFDAVLSARTYSPELSSDFDNLIMSFWAEADL